MKQPKIMKKLIENSRLEEICRRGAETARKNKPDNSNIDEQVKTLKRAMLSSRPDKIVRVNIEDYSDAIAFKRFAEKSAQLGIEFQYTNSNKHVVLNCIYWLTGSTKFRCLNPKNQHVMPGNLDKGLLITGNPGVGKTHILNVLNKLWEIDKPFFWSPTSQKIVDMCFGIIRARDLVSIYSSEGHSALQKYKTMPLLCIDDIGSETKIANYMGTKLNVIDDILTARMDNGKLITLATSNQDFEGLGNFYDPRLYSRLFEHFNLLTIHGKDFRMS